MPFSVVVGNGTGLVAHAEQLCDALEVEERSHNVEAQENVEKEQMAHLLYVRGIRCTAHTRVRAHAHVHTHALQYTVVALPSWMSLPIVCPADSLLSGRWTSNQSPTHRFLFFLCIHTLAGRNTRLRQLGTYKDDVDPNTMRTLLQHLQAEYRGKMAACGRDAGAPANAAAPANNNSATPASSFPQAAV